MVVERDEDRDDGRTDRPEPHILLPILESAAGENATKQHWLVQHSVFREVPSSACVKRLLVVIVERNWVLLCSFLLVTGS